MFLHTLLSTRFLRSVPSAKALNIETHLVVTSHLAVVQDKAAVRPADQLQLEQVDQVKSHS